MRNRILIAVLCCLTVLWALGPSRASAADDARLQWWREARFGMFIHWGPVSLKGTEIGWSRAGERRGMPLGGPGEIPVDVYDNLYRQFNPTKYDPKEWVAIAKRAGMKYMVFTTRHHDGFSMFDTAVSDYKITNSPYGRDIVAELAQACHEAGMRIGFYYSPPDWHHPDYRTENHARFIEYLHAQVRELCTKYGKLDIFWFDGLICTPKDWDAERLVKMIRSLQPGIIINDRSGLPEDYGTPEQSVGQFSRVRPWETCMTICNQWAWKPDDQMKSLKQCIDVLVRCAGGDGNLLFNVGPMPDGRIEDRQVGRLKEMGAWLERNGESIYGTRGGPFMPGAWGASTCRGNRIYLHILDWTAVGRRLELPAIPAKVLSASVPGGGKVSVRQTPRKLLVSVPKRARQELDTIVVLEVDKPAESLPVVSVYTNRPVAAVASNVFSNNAEYGADKAVDGDPSTRWASDGGLHAARLDLAYEKAFTAGRLTINEACAPRITSFELQYKSGAEWKTCYDGTAMGADFAADFPPVKAREFRLNILDAADGPTIWEIRVLPPKKKAN